MVPKVPVEHKTKVQEKIIQAALKNFAKNGYSETSMDDIAKSADVSKGGLYHHFPSKEDLFLAICKKNQQLLEESRAGLFEKKEKLSSDLGKFYDSMVDVNRNTEKIWLEGWAEAVRNPKVKLIVQKQREEIVLQIAGYLKKMKSDTGLFKNHSESDFRDLAKGICALFSGTTIDRVTGKNNPAIKKAWIKTMSAIFLGSR